MKLTRTRLAALLLAPLSGLSASETKIDRQALVTRHNIEHNGTTTIVPLGNGEFCFGADATGLQTFGGNAMAHWGWHSFPLPAGWTLDKVPPTGTFQQGRNKGGDVFPPNTEEIRRWMFDNPHILNLGRLRLCGADLGAFAESEITDVSRTLDLWSGVQISRYKIGGAPVRVETCVHPQLDAVAVRMESPLVASGQLGVVLDFGYPALQNSAWVGDFGRSTGHTTAASRVGEHRVDLVRSVDDTTYHVALAVAPGGSIRLPERAGSSGTLVIKKADYGTEDRWADVTATLSAVVRTGLPGPHVNYRTMGADPAPGRAKRLRVSYMLGGRELRAEVPDHQQLNIGAGAEDVYRISAARGTNVLEFVCAFSPAKVAGELPTVGRAREETSDRWRTFWSTGGAIDLSGSRDPRWEELERRIVLSEYLMAAMSAGSWPSSENGLLGLDPWRGQFHMEMVWWHLAHYALWDRWPMAERALGCYQRFVPAARALAGQLGYRGLKWPKSVGPEGRSAPWAGNQVLLWKQPHPIFFAEQDYRLHPTRATLEKWRDVVLGTADHLADYPTRDERTGIYSLVPAMPPSEQGITRDTVFDLAYWRWGLDKAQEWRQRLGLAREPRWDDVRNHLAPLPVDDGVFVHSAEWHDTYTKRAFEHPDPIGVLGLLPPMDGVDAGVAQRTVRKVWETWNWDRCWGWDFPWMAMAAARTGQPQLAVEALLKESKRNQYDPRGLCNGWYLPGNGGLLYAVAMMAAGWDGGPDKPAPGFPDDGSWVVKWEGLKKAQ